MRYLCVACVLTLQGCYLSHERSGAGDAVVGDAGAPLDAARGVDAAATCDPIETVVVRPGATLGFGFVAAEVPATVVHCSGADLKVLELFREGPPAPWGIESPVTPAYQLWLLDPARATTEQPCGTCFERLEGPRVIRLSADSDRVMVGFPRASWSGMPRFTIWYGR